MSTQDLKALEAREKRRAIKRKNVSREIVEKHSAHLVEYTETIKQVWTVSTDGTNELGRVLESEPTPVNAEEPRIYCFDCDVVIANGVVL